jgi:outer membrane protein OmpA-like peptidoglycan-associated protein
MGDLGAALLVLVALGCAASAQDSPPAAASPFSPGILPSGPEFSIVERSDYSRYLDGRYVGHVYRESRGLLRAEGAGYSGDCYVLEETIRDERVSSRRVERSLALAWGAPSGSLPADYSGFPSYRGLLAGAPERLEQGASWTSPGGYFLDLRDLGALSGGSAGEGRTLELPLSAEYRVKARASLEGRPVLAVACRFALRFSAPAASAADAEPDSPRLASVSGRHELDIYLDAETGSLVLVRDRFDDSYRFSSGPPERRAGFTLVFFRGASRFALASSAGSKGAGAPSEGAPPGEAALDAASVAPLSGSLEKAGVDIVESGRSVVLRVRDLPFLADSDEIVGGEEWRLDAIAEALRGIPERSFLVEGHSASVGKPEGELELSERRAKRIVDELAARGIAASRFIYRGLGSTRPLASNASGEGRARNRRVEITILDF